MIERGICYLTMCERDYPKRLAFAFLSDLRSEFESHLFAEHGDLWEQHVDSVRRPYAFIKFGAAPEREAAHCARAACSPHATASRPASPPDRVIQRKRREYEDMSSQGNVQRLNDTLYDVHNVMRDNLQHVLKRGKKLDRARTHPRVGFPTLPGGQDGARLHSPSPASRRCRAGCYPPSPPLPSPPLLPLALADRGV